jgi:transposase IS66
VLILLLGDGILQEIYLWYKEASLKVTYYFYYNGSLVVECFFNSFAGSIIAARYNVCKFFEYDDSTITRYVCMAYARHKFIVALRIDRHSTDIVNLNFIGRNLIVVFVS